MLIAFAYAVAGLTSICCMLLGFAWTSGRGWFDCLEKLRPKGWTVNLRGFHVGTLFPKVQIRFTQLDLSFPWQAQPQRNYSRAHHAGTVRPMVLEKALRMLAYACARVALGVLSIVIGIEIDEVRVRIFSRSGAEDAPGAIAGSIPPLVLFASQLTLHASWLRLPQVYAHARYARALVIGGEGELYTTATAVGEVEGRLGLEWADSRAGLRPLLRISTLACNWRDLTAFVHRFVAQQYVRQVVTGVIEPGALGSGFKAGLQLMALRHLSLEMCMARAGGSESDIIHVSSDYLRMQVCACAVDALHALFLAAAAAGESTRRPGPISSDPSADVYETRPVSRVMWSYACHLTDSEVRLRVMGLPSALALQPPSRSQECFAHGRTKEAKRDARKENDGSVAVSTLSSRIRVLWTLRCQDMRCGRKGTLAGLEMQGSVSTLVLLLAVRKLGVREHGCADGTMSLCPDLCASAVSMDSISERNPDISCTVAEVRMLQARWVHLVDCVDGGDVAVVHDGAVLRWHVACHVLALATAGQVLASRQLVTPKVTPCSRNPSPSPTISVTGRDTTIEVVCGVHFKAPRMSWHAEAGKITLSPPAFAPCVEKTAMSPRALYQLGATCARLTLACASGMHRQVWARILRAHVGVGVELEQVEGSDQTCLVRTSLTLSLSNPVLSFPSHEPPHPGQAMHALYSVWKLVQVVQKARSMAATGGQCTRHIVDAELSAIDSSLNMYSLPLSTSNSSLDSDSIISITCSRLCWRIRHDGRVGGAHENAACLNSLQRLDPDTSAAQPTCACTSPHMHGFSSILGGNIALDCEMLSVRLGRSKDAALTAAHVSYAGLALWTDLLPHSMTIQPALWELELPLHLQGDGGDGPGQALSPVVFTLHGFSPSVSVGANPLHLFLEGSVRSRCGEMVYSALNLRLIRPASVALARLVPSAQQNSLWPVLPWWDRLRLHVHGCVSSEHEQCSLVVDAQDLGSKNYREGDKLLLTAENCAMNAGSQHADAHGDRTRGIALTLNNFSANIVTPTLLDAPPASVVTLQQMSVDFSVTWLTGSAMTPVAPFAHYPLLALPAAGFISDVFQTFRSTGVDIHITSLLRGDSRPHQDEENAFKPSPALVITVSEQTLMRSWSVMRAVQIRMLDRGGPRSTAQLVRNVQLSISLEPCMATFWLPGGGGEGPRMLASVLECTGVQATVFGCRGRIDGICASCRDLSLQFLRAEPEYGELDAAEEGEVMFAPWLLFERRLMSAGPHLGPEEGGGTEWSQEARRIAAGCSCVAEEASCHASRDFSTPASSATASAPCSLRISSCGVRITWTVHVRDLLWCVWTSLARVVQVGEKAAAGNGPHLVIALHRPQLCLIAINAPGKRRCAVLMTSEGAHATCVHSTLVQGSGRKGEEEGWAGEGANAYMRQWSVHATSTMGFTLPEVVALNVDVDNGNGNVSEDVTGIGSTPVHWLLHTSANDADTLPSPLLPFLYPVDASLTWSSDVQTEEGRGTRTVTQRLGQHLFLPDAHLRMTGPQFFIFLDVVKRVILSPPPSSQSGLGSAPPVHAVTVPVGQPGRPWQHLQDAIAHAVGGATGREGYSGSTSGHESGESDEGCGVQGVAAPSSTQTGPHHAEVPPEWGLPASRRVGYTCSFLRWTLEQAPRPGVMTWEEAALNGIEGRGEAPRMGHAPVQVQVSGVDGWHEYWPLGSTRVAVSVTNVRIIRAGRLGGSPIASASTSPRTRQGLSPRTGSGMGQGGSHVRIASTPSVLPHVLLTMQPTLVLGGASRWQPPPFLRVVACTRPPVSFAFRFPDRRHFAERRPLVLADGDGDGDGLLIPPAQVLRSWPPMPSSIPSLGAQEQRRVGETRTRSGTGHDASEHRGLAPANAFTATSSFSIIGFTAPFRYLADPAQGRRGSDESADSTSREQGNEGENLDNAVPVDAPAVKANAPAAPVPLFPASAAADLHMLKVNVYESLEVEVLGKSSDSSKGGEGERWRQNRTWAEHGQQAPAPLTPVEVGPSGTARGAARLLALRSSTGTRTGGRRDGPGSDSERSAALLVVQVHRKDVEEVLAYISEPSLDACEEVGGQRKADGHAGQAVVRKEAAAGSTTSTARTTMRAGLAAAAASSARWLSMRGSREERPQGGESAVSTLSIPEYHSFTRVTCTDMSLLLTAHGFWGVDLESFPLRVRPLSLRAHSVLTWQDVVRKARAHVTRELVHAAPRLVQKAVTKAVGRVLGAAARVGARGLAGAASLAAAAIRAPPARTPSPEQGGGEEEEEGEEVGRDLS